MKRIVAILLMGVMLLSGGGSVMVSAESPIDYLQEEVETEWTKEKLEADFIEKYMMEEGSVKDSLPEEAADKMKRYLYITEEDRELVLDKMEETCN